MRFDIITIFPGIFDSYFGESIIRRAKDKNLIKIKIHNLRDYTEDKHNKVDDTPYGGGAGMVMKVQPIYDCVEYVKSDLDSTISTSALSSTSRIILFSAKGKRYTQQDTLRLSKYDNLIFICGRYEGVDERVAQYVADEEISIGDFVLTGGEIPAMVLVDSISRLIPGVLGNPDSLSEESFNAIVRLRKTTADAQCSGEIKDLENIGEYPQYTKPEIFFPEKNINSDGWSVPEVLLSGNHGEIKKWREQKSKKSAG